MVGLWRSGEVAAGWASFGMQLPDPRLPDDAPRDNMPPGSCTQQVHRQTKMGRSAAT